jgi:hypothetical protein
MQLPSELIQAAYHYYATSKVLHVTLLQCTAGGMLVCNLHCYAIAVLIVLVYVHSRMSLPYAQFQLYVSTVVLDAYAMHVRHAASVVSHVISVLAHI